MTNRRLRRCFGALLGALVVWPPLQFWFTSEIEGTPWKLFGLAMYSTVHETEVVVLDESGGKREPIELGALSPEASHAVKSFARYRRVFGTLADASSAAEQIFRERPGTSALGFDVRLRRLDVASARLETRRTTLSYARGAL